MGMGGPWKFRDQAGCDPESMITERCPVTVDVLGKVRTNEMRGQPRDDLGDKQILMTSNSFWFFSGISLTIFYCRQFLSLERTKRRLPEPRQELPEVTNVRLVCTIIHTLMRMWEAVVDTSMYEGEWVVVVCVGGGERNIVDASGWASAGADPLLVNSCREGSSPWGLDVFLKCFWSFFFRRDSVLG